MKREKIVKQIEESIMKNKKPNQKSSNLLRKNLLSTGSTLLNLACSDNPYGGFLKGRYYFLVGDSASGKTFLSMTCFAEAITNKHFQDYRFIYDNVEDGCLMDLENLFGKKVAEKMEPPSKNTEGGASYSSTIEEFYFNIDDLLQQKKPFIYVLDSMDGLTSEAEVNKFTQHKDAYRKGKQISGSFGDGKAKKNSEGLRKVLNGLRDTGSILIIICQTRDNLGFGFEKKTRSGGHALKFYSTIEIWSNILGTIKKTIQGKERKIGVHIGLKIKKNRITGKEHEVEINIYPSYGIDDIGSCIDYLVEEYYWSKTKQSITAKEFNITTTREKLIQHIEENNLIKELQSITGLCWKNIDEACDLKRKKRYEEKDINEAYNSKEEKDIK